jgi:murein tripeptide amidase MpaA
VAYLSVEEIESAVRQLAQAYPGTCTVIELPHLTHEGRRVLALRLAWAAGAPAALFLGGVHSREMMPPDLLISLAADLLEAAKLGTGLRYGGRYFTATDITSLTASAGLVIVPCVNPDGRNHCIAADGNWRKNRNPTHGSGTSSCCGVDLNRNFPFLWDHINKFAPAAGVATSDDPCHRFLYRGDAEASEPETRNVIHLLDSEPGLRWMIDIHSAVPAIYHTWGSDEPQSTDQAMNFRNPAFDALRGLPGDTGYKEFMPEADLAAAKKLGTLMQKAVKDVRGGEYEVAPSFTLYPTSGASDDYAYSRHFADAAKPKLLSYTIECGRAFWPAWAEAENVIRETSAGLIAFLGAAPAETAGLYAVA